MFNLPPQHRVRRRSLMLAALVVVLAATLVGCGSSGEDGETGAGSAQASSFGTLSNVCHEAEGTNADGDHGVTADSIRITTISDAGSPLQSGLNQELWDAATVFTRWCNELGGINGREILLVKGDAQVTRYKTVIEQSCESSFALVGGGGALDDLDGAQQLRVECGLVAIPGFVASPEARGAPLSYPAMASGITAVTGTGLKYLQEAFGANQDLATVYGDFPSTQFAMDQRISASQAVGLASSASPVNEVSAEEEVPEGEPAPIPNTYPITGLSDARGIAQAVLDSGASGLLFSGQPTDLANLVNALSAQMDGDDALEWVFTDENMYDQELIQSARTGLAEVPVYLQAFTYPYEEVDQGERSAAMDDLLALFEKYLPNGKSRAMFAASSFASWLLFAQTADACGAELTRECLVEQLREVGSFDAGGLIAPRDPSNPSLPSECAIVLEATPDGFERVEAASVAPTEGMGRDVFNCSPVNIITVTDSPVMREWQAQVTTAFESVEVPLAAAED